MYGNDMIYMFLYKIGQECIEFGLYTMNEMKELHQLHIFMKWILPTTGVEHFVIWK